MSCSTSRSAMEVLKREKAVFMTRLLSYCSVLKGATRRSVTICQGNLPWLTPGFFLT